MAKLPPLVACIIAEQVRGEMGGKSTILGYSGICPNIQIDASAIPGLTTLSALLQLSVAREEDGDPVVEVEVDGPSGMLMPRTAVKDVRIVPGNSAVVALNFQGFPIVAAGVYTVVLYHDSVVHSRNTFSVRLAQAQ